jgi:GT2 family glycosyltransferase
MKQNNYHFYTATPESTELPKWMSLSEHVSDIDGSVKFDNTEGLPLVYNRFLKSRTWDADDRVVFLHDDLHIHDTNIVEKLDQAHEKYDVVGLAGCGGKLSKTDVAMWHLMGEIKSGTVTHTKDGQYWTNVYGPNDVRCVFMDGLFLSVNPSLLLEKDVWFDEDFDFHHYDSSFFLRCARGGLICGTPPTPIFVIHEGMGETTNAFLKSNEIFKQKYYSW